MSFAKEATVHEINSYSYYTNDENNTNGLMFAIDTCANQNLTSTGDTGFLGDEYTLRRTFSTTNGRTRSSSVGLTMIDGDCKHFCIIDSKIPRILGSGNSPGGKGRNLIDFDQRRVIMNGKRHKMIVKNNIPHIYAEAQPCFREEKIIHDPGMSSDKFLACVGIGDATDKSTPGSTAKIPLSRVENEESLGISSSDEKVSAEITIPESIGVQMLPTPKDLEGMSSMEEVRTAIIEHDNALKSYFEQVLTAKQREEIEHQHKTAGHSPNLEHLFKDKELEYLKYVRSRCLECIVFDSTHAVSAKGSLTQYAPHRCHTWGFDSFDTAYGRVIHIVDLFSRTHLLYLKQNQQGPHDDNDLVKG